MFTGLTAAPPPLSGQRTAGAGLGSPRSQAARAQPPPTRRTLDLEQDLLAVPTLVQDPNQDYWMWQRLVAGLAMFDTARFSFPLDHLRPAAALRPTSPRLMGGSEAAHMVQATLNGIVVGQDTWQGPVSHNYGAAASSALSWKELIVSASRR